MSTTNHDLVIEHGDQLVKATVDCTWRYERNPGDMEQAHYGGEDDGYYLEDWKLEGEVEISNGDKLVLTTKDPPKEILKLIEDAVENLTPDSP